MGAHCHIEVGPMPPSTGVWKRKREDLKSKRTPLFEKYKKSPNDLLLALKIKVIDDEIAECTEHMQREQLSGGAKSTSKS
jgi:hypothetical protein